MSPWHPGSAPVLSPCGTLDKGCGISIHHVNLHSKYNHCLTCSSMFYLHCGCLDAELVFGDVRVSTTHAFTRTERGFAWKLKSFYNFSWSKQQHHEQCFTALRLLSHVSLLSLPASRGICSCLPLLYKACLVILFSYIRQHLSLRGSSCIARCWVDRTLQQLLYSQLMLYTTAH